jgi:DNA polymerase-3 subunit epsilon
VKIERPIVFLDIESTGVDPVHDRIVELGMVAYLPDGQRVPWSKRFNPEMPIPPASTEVHGITDEDVKDCPLFADYAGKVARSIAGKDLAGYNPWRMDLPMLDEELRRAGHKLDLTGVRVIDCFGIFSKKEPKKLEDAVRKYCGREHDGAHGALADAAATLDVFLGQIGMYPELAAMELGSIADFSRIQDNPYIDVAGKLYRDKDGDARYAFGPQRDKKVSDEPGFGHWMLNKDFPESTREALMAEFDRLAEVA